MEIAIVEIVSQVFFHRAIFIGFRDKLNTIAVALFNIVCFFKCYRARSPFI